jgi:type IV secretion system protein VirD4
MTRLLAKIIRPFITMFRFLVGDFKPTIYGNAKWMGRLDQWIFLSARNRGLIFSSRRRLNLDESFRNCCLTAPTGSGKTTRFVIPNILSCSGSIVVTDPSGEIYQKTSGHMADRGYNIQVLQPAELSQSLRFNPLEKFRSAQNCKQLATILGRNNTGSDPFWTTGAIQILYLCLLALTATRDDRLIHLGNVRLLLNRFGIGGEGVHTFMRGRLDQIPYGEYKAFLEQDDKVVSGVLSTARAALDLWSDPDIVRFSASNSVSIEALRESKTIIYLIVPEDQIRYFSVLLNMFYTACFEFCLRHSGHPVFFFLDEFGNLGHIDNFSSIITTLRKRDCSISIILQELSQLTVVYGQHEGRSIFAGGISNKLFFAGLDLETATYLERVLGRSTAQEMVWGRESKSGRTITEGKPLMSADRIRMMTANEGILISGSYPPVLLKMPPYFRNWVMKRKTEKPPVLLHIDYAKEAVTYLQIET